MTFEKWLKLQKNRNDPIGDLACDFIDTRSKTIKESLKKFHPCEDAKISIENAYLQYVREVILP